MGEAAAERILSAAPVSPLRPTATLER
jgi:hypothetical protein